MLVAAANPCPCGRGEADPECSCAPLAVQRYQGRLSGALADRIDILAAVRQPSAAGDRRRAGRALGGGARAGRRRPRAAGAPARAGSLQRRDDSGRGARLRARGRRGARCSPTSTRAGGSAAAPTTGRCGWPGPSPTSPGPRRSARSRWPRRCSCGGATMAEPRACPRVPAPLLAAGAARPLHREDRDRGGRARARRSCCGSPTRTWSRRRRRRSAASCSAAVEALEERALERELLAAECWACCRHGDALPGAAARRRRRSLGADRARRPGAARRPRAARRR